MKLSEQRPNEAALPDIYYAQDEIEHLGDPPAPIPDTKISIKMAKHHVISWGILRGAWNKAHDEKKDAGKFIYEGIYRVMAHTTAPMPESEESVRQAVCWSRGNLIIGPEGAIRLFDPGEKIDFESPAGMKDPGRSRVINLVEFGVLLNTYKTTKVTLNETWKSQFNGLVDTLYNNYMDLCVFERSAWKLYRKATVTWGKSPIDPEKRENKGSTQGWWYRAGVSSECVAKLFPDGPTSKNIGTNVKGQREKDLKEDLRLNLAAEILKDKLAREAVDQSDKPFVSVEVLKDE